MGSTVWFGLLGPVDIRLDDVPVPLPSARTRTLLAALLCQANRVVSVDGLIDAVWAGDPPDGAVTTLRSHVMRLRRCLGPQARRLETVAPGYRILLDPGTELDTRIFVDRYQAGQAAAELGDWRSAARLAAEALALWRGQPLADVPSEQLHLDEAAAWSELRVEAVELRARADIALGRPAEAAAAMRRLAAEHPHREPAYALLMSALAAADRRAEALQVYRLLRTLLVRDLGMEPSPELRALHQGILAMDAADASGAADSLVVAADDRGRDRDGAAGERVGGDQPRTAAFPAWPTPRTLPRDVADFVGREDQLRRLVEAVSGFVDAAHPREFAGPLTVAAAAAPNAAFAAVIDGMAGVGKSAFAVRAAHALADRFPDGQLYADLLGTSPEPARPRAVLAAFLRLLGIAPAALPDSDLERVALYRSLLAGRRVLILLDGVRDANQLAPLIPAGPGCALLVTTRDRRVGVAGATRLALSSLTPDESRTLFGRIAGTDRAAAEPEATDQILTACAGLPLAIRAAAGRVAARPTWRVADLAARLTPSGAADAPSRLDELRFAEHDVRASLEAGLGRPDDPVVTALCLLSLWNGAELALPVAAALLGRPVPQTEEMLEHLVDRNLLHSPRHGRYLLHDLVRAFAAEKAHALLTDDQRHAAAELWRLPHARTAEEVRRSSR